MSIRISLAILTVCVWLIKLVFISPDYSYDLITACRISLEMFLPSSYELQVRH